MLKLDLLLRQVKAGSVKLLPNNSLEVFPMPCGAVCSIEKEGNSIVTRNGRTTFRGDEFGRRLWDAGVRGQFIITHNGRARHVARWFSYFQHEAPCEEWINEIVIHTIDGLKGSFNGLEVKAIKGIVIPAEDIYSASLEWSKDINFDGFIIPAVSHLNEVRYYHALPIRNVEGEILDVVHWGTRYAGIIVKVHSPNGLHVFLNTRISICVKKQINEHCLNGFAWAIGKQLKMTYCTYQSGDCFNNYTCTVAINIIE